VRVVLAYLTCSIVWGTTWFAIRVCIGEGGYPTIAAAALRFTIAAVLLLFVVALMRAEPGPQGRRQRSWLILAGLLNGVGYALVYKGEESVPGAFAAIIFGTFPLVTALLAVITKTERVSIAQVLGSMMSLLGIGIIFWDRLAVSNTQAAGIALLCGGVVVSAFYSLILKREGHGVHVLRSTSWFLGVTAVFLWIVALGIGETSMPWPPPTEPSLALLYLAVFGSVLTFGSLLYLLKHVSLMTTTTLVFIQPLIALFVDHMWESEADFSTRSYVGAGVTMSGVVLSLLWKHFRRPQK
jgi:drug/metabolite transporter (DMT)-like permease